MTALTADRNTARHDGKLYSYPMAAATQIYAGSLVVLDASGNAEPGPTATGKMAVGRAEENVNNTGAAAAKSITVRAGVFRWVNSDSITKTSIGDTGYIVDDQTIAKAASGKSAAGIIVDVDSEGVWVDTRPEVSLGTSGLLAANNLSDVADAATSATNLGLGTADAVVHATMVARQKTHTVAGNAYTVVNGTDADIVIFANADTDIVTLPAAAAANLGQKVTVICGAADGGAKVSISPNAADNIFGTIAAVSASGTDDKDWELTKATQNKGDYCVLVSDGSTGWAIMGGVGVWASEA